MHINLYGTKANCIVRKDMHDLTNTHISNSFKNGIMTFDSTSPLLYNISYSTNAYYFIYIKYHEN